MGDIEVTNCDVCGKYVQVIRKYYYYDLNCMCCGGGKHFEIVRHCKDCLPSKPEVFDIKNDRNFINLKLI